MKKLPILLLLLAGVLLCVGGWRAAAAAAYNRSTLLIPAETPGGRSLLQRGPERAAEESQYIAGVPLEEMDLGRVHFDAADGAGWGVGGEQRAGQVELPRTIRYYRAPRQDAETAAEIPAGTVVLALLGAAPYPLETPFALFTYPTYKAGWRYCTSLTETADGAGRTDCCYARTEELLAVVEALLPESAYWQTMMQTYDLTVKEAAQVFLFQLDRLMYSSGYYVSPDIYHEPWDGWTVGLLAAGGVLLAADGALVLRGRRKAGPRSA